MAPTKPDIKSRLPIRKQAATNSHFKDEETLLIWKAFNLTNKEVSTPALAEELNLNVPAARMRWSRLKAKLGAFEKKENEAKTAASAAAATATAATTDATMEDIGDTEDTKEAKDNEDSNGASNDEGAK
ncbi:hypothetical protein N7491_001409 [Penicillium cf. griseofulvum]|uniref:Myb-like DNA-binding domain-containing protein n=1 Tax=Penicillium cf. griseofulvum TaxID=2972120 RepID=A0A9W9JC59_9EURO|nr:hypothetical protein N7472_006539 [Penicillium cf. griseofulvum]KAJ5445327.1 hypothetical protein N7491_001409 [Penicillium cf. griseofulvum]KAJ5447045.1 hypothetical protein N7445_001866 [Penicillium cf. griseofulvum]